MRRRDQRRWEDFQTRKSQTFSNSPVTESRPPATDSRQEAKVPRILQTGNPNSAVRSAPKSENPNLEPKPSPAPPKMEVDDPPSDFVNDTKDIRLVFCAPNQNAAKNQAKKNFSKSKYEPQLNDGSSNHFTFSIKMNSSELKLLERDAQKLNHSVNLYEIEEIDEIGQGSSMRCGAKHCRECPDK